MTVEQWEAAQQAAWEALAQAARAHQNAIRAVVVALAAGARAQLPAAANVCLQASGHSGRLLVVGASDGAGNDLPWEGVAEWEQLAGELSIQDVDDLAWCLRRWGQDVPAPAWFLLDIPAALSTPTPQ